MAELNLLQQLHDLHTPQPPGIWPWAWGWWLLIFSLALILTGSGFGLQLYRRRQVKRDFLWRLHQLELAYQQQPLNTHAIELALLLKQVALYYYPRDQVASLHGQAWLDFLQATSREPIPAVTHIMLKKMIYQAKTTHAELGPSLQFVRSWIKQQSKPCMS